MASIKRGSALGYKLNIGDVIWGYDSYESIESIEPLVSGMKLRSHINQRASSLTGRWLKNPQKAIKNGNWIGPDVVPLEYNQGSEELAIYLFDGGSGGGAITGSFGIDNHLAVWVNGEYRFGAYSPIHFYENDLPFKEVDLGTLQPGINAIQILRSDQYGWAGADWEINYDSDASIKEDNDPGDKVKEEDATPRARPTLKELSSSYIGIDHLGKPFYKLQGDLWWGKKDARIISSKEGDDAFSVKFYLGSKGKKHSGNLDNGKPTIVYSPGWQDSPSSPNSQNWWKKMYAKVGDSANLAIVDWSGMAEKTGKMVMPIFEATVTRQVGEVVADALIKAGAKPSDLTLVGHSLGSFVMGSAAMEIKRLTKKKVNEFVALDTAFGLSDIPNWFGNLFTGKQWSDYDTDVRPEANGMSPGEDLPYDFTRKLAKKTTSYTVSDLSGLLGSSAGNNTRGATAMHPYIVQYTPTVEWTGNPFTDPAIATAYHNGTIGIYADLFAKDNLHPDSTYQLSKKKSFNARGEVVKSGKGEFKGVIVAPQPWSSDVKKRKAPNSIGWLDPDSDSHYPDIYGSAHDDFMFFDGFNNGVLGLYDTNKGVRLFAGDGNDSLASMQQDGKGVDTLIGGKGADVFHIGFGRYGQKIQPYKDKWDIDLFGKGTGSYVVIEDFKPKQKDKIIFGWNQKNIGYKSISEFGIAGAGTAFHVGGDLVAYVPTLDPGDKKTENWINNPRYFEFVGKNYMTDFDSHLLNG